MDEFHINFNIFGKYFESWQNAKLSPVKKRKREESSEEAEVKLLKNTMNGNK